LGFGDANDPAHNMSLLTVVEGNIRACACVKECAEELKEKGKGIQIRRAHDLGIF
jgi:hypothetical protein